EVADRAHALPDEVNDLFALLGQRTLNAPINLAPKIVPSTIYYFALLATHALARRLPLGLALVSFTRPAFLRALARLVGKGSRIFFPRLFARRWFVAALQYLARLAENFGALDICEFRHVGHHVMPLMKAIAAEARNPQATSLMKRTATSSTWYIDFNTVPPPPAMSVGGAVSMEISTSRLASMRGSPMIDTSALSPTAMMVSAATPFEANTGRSNSRPALNMSFIAVPGSQTNAMLSPLVGDTAATSLPRSCNSATELPPVAGEMPEIPLSKPGGSVELPAAFENSAASNAAARLSAITRRTICSACEASICSRVNAKMVANLWGSRLTPALTLSCRTGIPVP